MRVALAVLLGGLLASCGGAAVVDGPLVGRIDDAIAALSGEIGVDDPSLFEIAVDLTGITLVLAETEIAADTGEATGTFATPYRWEGGSIARAGETSAADGAVFSASAVDVDPERIFERVRAELDSPDIVDLVIQGGPDGSPVIDATVVNDRGGTLLVLLGDDGAILGVQAA